MLTEGIDLKRFTLTDNIFHTILHKRCLSLYWILRLQREPQTSRERGPLKEDARLAEISWAKLTENGLKGLGAKTSFEGYGF